MFIVTSTIFYLVQAFTSFDKSGRTTFPMVAMVAIPFNAALWKMLYLKMRCMEPYNALAATDSAEAATPLDLRHALYSPLQILGNGNGVMFYPLQGTIIATLVVPLLKTLFTSDNRSSTAVMYTIPIFLAYNLFVVVNMFRDRNRHTGLAADLR